MKRILFYLFIFFSFNVFSQTTDWVKSFGGDLSDKGISIGTDSLGYIYISGYFNTAADFGEISLSNPFPEGSNKEAFLCKVDPLGNVLWALAGGDAGGWCFLVWCACAVLCCPLHAERGALLCSLAGYS